MMTLRQKLRRYWLDVSYLPLVVTASITIGIIYFIFNQSQEILKERLRERLTSMVGIAAQQLDANSVEKIQGPDDLYSKELDILASQMKQIRESAKNIKYIYILRPTENPNVTQFVVDADMAVPVDWDGNGQIDEVEVPPLPGDDYDISENPSARVALARPAANEDTYTDKWGTFLSGYAPIRNKSGEVVGMLGIDIQVDQFSTIVRAMFVPFVILSVLLLIMLTIQTVSLIRIWQNRVDFVKELDRQKDELLGMVSHQLATPITSVKWYIEMMLGGDLGKITQEQRSHLNSVLSISSDLTDLVSMILDVSRIQLGKMKIEKKELDLNVFFKEIMEVIHPKAEQKKVHLNVSIADKLPLAMLDKRYTRMTIENLLTNAVKYTPENGNVDFKVQLKNGGKTLYCEVRDTGCGIPQNEQSKIFGKMFRASNVRNSIDGNGFGLYVAKGAIDAQGGKIWFTSEEGKGTTFYVELPVRD
jgi:signal transduction histidine kinase